MTVRSPAEPTVDVVADRVADAPEAEVVAAVGEVPGAASGQVASLAARLGCTEGQVYTMVIATVSASVLVGLGGVPLGERARAVRAAPPAVSAPLPPAVSAPLPPAVPLAPPPAVGQLLPEAPATVGFPIDEAQDSPPPSFPSQPEGPTDYRVPGAPRALASDTSYVYAGTDGAPARLVVLSRTGDPARMVTVTGSRTEREGGLSAAARYGDQLLVTDRSRGALLQLDPRTGAQRLLATLPDLPPCLVGITGSCQPGGQDQPPSPEGVAVAGESVYVADATQGTIWRYSVRTKQLVAWYSSSDFPTSGPSGLGVDNAGRVVFTVAETADLAAPLQGALYRIEVSAQGGPGARTLLATFERGTTPGPVAVGRADDVYVGLRTAGGVVVVSRDGEARPLPGATAARLPAPGGLSLADGVLFVADAGRPATASSGQVESVPVGDGPA